MDDWLSNTATVATSSSTTLTIDDIKKAIDIVKSLPPEPFGQWMKEAGKSPEDGYELHLPVQLEEQFPNVPEYVKFSRAAHKPIIVPSLNIRTFKYD